MPIGSKLTNVGDHDISGEYDEYTVYVYAPPFSNTYTAQLNGSNQWLNFTGNSNMSLSSGVFSIESWIKLARYSSNYNGVYAATIIANDISIAAGAAGLEFNVEGTASSWTGLRIKGAYQAIYTGIDIVGNYNFDLNTWYHVAVVGTGSTATLYVNGVSIASGSYTPWNDNTTWTIGRNNINGYNYYFPGYISNLRVLKGTSNFTPSSSPLTAIAGTQLLTCQDATIVDNSTNAFIITNNNSVTTSQVLSSLPSSKQRQYSNGNLNIAGEFDEYTLQNNSYAVSFNGSSQYLSAPNTVSNFGTGDFTAECWIYPTNSVGGGFIGNQDGGTDNNYWIISRLSDGRIEFQIRDATNQAFVTGSVSTTINTWTHIAVTRQSGLCKLFVNGVSDGTPLTITKTITSRNTIVGAFLYTGFVNYFTGYVSNVRIVKGTAVYTSNFTPPISPLTAITNTSLLTCQNPAIVDNSTNAFTITNNNTATTSIVTSGASFLKTKQKQFSSGDLDIAGKFDEYTMTNGVYSVPFSGTSGEYLTVPSGVLVFGTNNFTVESWIYTTSYNISGSGGEVIIDNYMSQTSGSYSVGQWTLWINGSGALSFTYTSSTTTAVTITGTTVTAFAWNHVAVVRNGTTITLYLNGASVASGTYAGTIGATGTSYIGGQAAGSGLTYRYAGSISNLRVLNNNALYTANFTVPSRPLTINSNTTASFPILPTTNTTLLTCQLPYMEDNSTNGYIIGNPASLTPSIVPNKFYNAYFDGGFINTMIQTPNNARYNVFGVSASTIEFYYYSRSTRAGHLCIVGIGNQDRAYIISNGAALTVGTAIAGIYNTRITAPTSIVQYRWYHVALTRVGSTVSLYLDGVLQGTSTASFYSNAGGVTVTFGTQPYGGGSSNDWYIGLMSNIRILNGTALYTGNFTPPTDRLTAITNTVLLTLVSSAGIVDETGLATLSNPRTLPYNAPLF